MNLIKEERMAENAEKIGDFLLSNFKKFKFPFIKEVRGKGLLIAIEYVPSLK